MLTGRDRLLAALFALQLLAAAAFGLVLVNGLGRSNATEVVSQGGAPAGSVDADVTPSPLPSGETGAATGTQGTAGTSGTAGTAGSSGTVAGAGGSGTTPPTGPGATAGGSAGTVKAGAPIKIGSIVTQTGAINFAASAQGTKAYLDRVNAQGGVNGHKIALDLRDDQLDAARGRAQAEQLVADGAFAFAAFQAPLTEDNLVPFLEQNKIPLIGGYGTRPEYKSPQAFIFQSGHYGFEMGRFLAQEKSVTRPGVIFIGSGDAAIKAQKQAFTEGVKAGGKTLNPDDILVADVTKASYDDFVTQFRLGGVDGMATLVDQTAYNRLQQSLDRQNYHPVHVADPLFTDPSVRQSATTEGTLVATDFAFVNDSSADVQDYVKTVKAKYGGSAQVGYLGLAGWLSAKILVEALDRLGDDLTRPRLLQVMESLPADVGGDIIPKLTFGKAPHDLNRCLQLGRIKGGNTTAYKGFACDDKTYG